MGERTRHFSKMLDSSEMFCSLRFEDVKGCPYNTFTPRGIAVLSLASSIMALVSLIVAV